MKTKYIVIEKNQNRNKITELGDFDNYEEAKKHIEELFFLEFNSSDIPEHYSDYVKLENEKYIFTGGDSWEHDQRYYSIVESDEEELADFLNDLEQQRAIELYNSVGMNTDFMLEDYNNDLLTINDGSDGNKYLWYMDDNYDIAINIETGEIVDAEQTEKLFA